MRLAHRFEMDLSSQTLCPSCTPIVHQLGWHAEGSWSRQNGARASPRSFIQGHIFGAHTPRAHARGRARGRSTLSISSAHTSSSARRRRPPSCPWSRSREGRPHAKREQRSGAVRHRERGGGARRGYCSWTYSSPRQNLICTTATRRPAIILPLDVRPHLAQEVSELEDASECASVLSRVTVVGVVCIPRRRVGYRSYPRAWTRAAPYLRFTGSDRLPYRVQSHLNSI
jgi:hypothetical protein